MIDKEECLRAAHFANVEFRGAVTYDPNPSSLFTY